MPQEFSYIPVHDHNGKIVSNPSTELRTGLQSLTSNLHIKTAAPGRRVTDMYHEVGTLGGFSLAPLYHEVG
jgi:hypothetical protein